jgi:uncharacterized membrane protein YphA (DoxX/SURF4 family)
MDKITGAWNKFFFTPVSPTTLGLFRIIFGTVVFLSNLGQFPARNIFYGENAIVRFQTMDQMFPRVHPWLFFRWMPQADPALEFFFIFLLVVNILFVLGLFTRVTSVLLFLGVLTMNNRNPFVENAGDTLLRVNLFYLMFSECGAAYSIDRWIRVKEGKETKSHKLIPAWPQRLLQLQLVYVYLDTIYLKLPGDGWRDGTAMYYALGYIEMRRFDLRPIFFYHLWQIKLATYSVFIGEASVGLFIWIKKMRYWLMGVAFCLHEGINLTMQFPVFQYAMMASLINFIYPEDTERFIAYIGTKLRDLSPKPS